MAYARSSQRLTVTRGRARSVPVQITNSETTHPVDLTGASLSATFSGPDFSFAPTVAAVDLANGKFRVSWTADQVAALPLGQHTTLNVSYVDTSGETFDFDYPVCGVAP